MVNKYMHQIVKNMDNVKLYEAKWAAKPRMYNVFRAFNPHAFLGTMGRSDTDEITKYGQSKDAMLMQKFFKRFPQLKVMPRVFGYYREAGTDHYKNAHPIHDFIVKYKKLKNKGYSEYKAFKIVEEELRDVLEDQLDETRILRGAAMSAYGDSYLDRSQRVAELESEMKLMRFMRDMPKHERNSDYLQQLEREINPDAADTDAEEQENTRYDRLEDLFSKGQADAFSDAVSYEPVMYKLVKEQEAKNKQDESMVEIQQGFLDRTERLLRSHQQRSHIHDGLKQLSDAEIIQKVRESPTQLKSKGKGFLKVLQRYNVHLDEDANPVYDNIKDPNIVKFLKTKDTLVKVTLMSADLDFEYPQKLEKLVVRSDLLKWLDEEEEKLKNIALEEYLETESQKKASVKLTPGKDFILTYDEYYGNKDLVADSMSRIKIGESGMIEKALTYEEYAQKHLTDQIFDNDMIEQEYKFWETNLEKEQRLKKTWIDMNRQQALGGVDAVSQEDHAEMTNDIIEMIRKIRWKVDQELVRRNHRPLYHQNYMDKYEKEEFLIDADMEFFKVKKLMEKNPKMLRDDPVLSIDYHKIITLIRQKKLTERTSDHFNPANAYKASWKDVHDADRQKLVRERADLDKYNRSLRMDFEGGAGGGDDLDLEEDEATTIKNSKKAEAKQKRAIITQFDKIATSFSTKQSAVGKDHQITTRDGSEINQTAGMIKKAARNKDKKEKTLGAKLRLKTKKGGGDLPKK